MEEVPFGKFGFIKKESVDWMKNHLPMIGGGVLCTVVGLMGAFYWLRGDSQGDFLAADIAYQRWEGQPGDHFVRLQKLLKKHPELHAKYDGAIAQKLLGYSESGLAASYGKAALRRIGDFSPYYTDFSRCSLLIAEGQLLEALDKAKTLKISMEKDDAFWEKKSEVVRHGCILFAYNLLRIAVLEKAAGTSEGELAAWQELKKNAGWDGSKPTSKTYDPEAYLLIQENFQSQDISLLDYIQYREKLLTLVP